MPQPFLNGQEQAFLLRKQIRWKLTVPRGLDPGKHIHATPLAIEGNHAVDESKERVVGTHAYIFSGVKLRSHLPNENVAGRHFLAAKLFDATPLGI